MAFANNNCRTCFGTVAILATILVPIITVCALLSPSHHSTSNYLVGVFLLFFALYANVWTLEFTYELTYKVFSGILYATASRQEVSVFDFIESKSIIRYKGSNNKWYRIKYITDDELPQGKNWIEAPAACRRLEVLKRDPTHLMLRIENLPPPPVLTASLPCSWLVSVVKITLTSILFLISLVLGIGIPAMFSVGMLFGSFAFLTADSSYDPMIAAASVSGIWQCLGCVILHFFFDMNGDRRAQCYNPATFEDETLPVDDRVDEECPRS